MTQIGWRTKVWWRNSKLMLPGMLIPFSLTWQTQFICPCQNWRKMKVCRWSPKTKILKRMLGVSQTHSQSCKSTARPTVTSIHMTMFQSLMLLMINRLMIWTLIEIRDLKNIWEEQCSKVSLDEIRLNKNNLKVIVSKSNRYNH